MFVPPNVAGNFLASLPTIRSNFKTQRSEFECENLRVIKQGERITIEGSLSTYINGNNFESLDCNEFGVALESLSQRLGIDCFECQVWRVEFAGTITVTGKPPLYFPCFQARPGLHANNMRSGVYLQNKSLVIYVYHKRDEDHLKALRLEVRRNKGVARSIGRHYPILTSDLTKPETFERFTRDWHKQITSVLVAPGELPAMPERLNRKSLAEIESQLCRSNPETRSKLTQIAEAYDRAGMLDKNLRPELRRELYGPHSEPENRRLQELQTKIEALAAPHIHALEGTFDPQTEPNNSLK